MSSKKHYFGTNFREYFSAPFIYFMIFPALFLHISLIIYQNTFFRLCKIPLIKIKDFVSFDRNNLEYLTFLQKLNCAYCSYVNGLFAYAVKIASQTERYWCPIKHQEKLEFEHYLNGKFAEYGNFEEFSEIYTREKALRDLKD